ncbi:MAG TPA: DUF547 domain-containing protein [Candidatus Polarisedimenticolia bacterium]
MPRPGLTLPTMALVLAIACGAPGATPIGGPASVAVRTALASGRERFDHGIWDRLLTGAVREGRVDYLYLHDRRDRLDEYLQSVATAPLQRLAPAELEALLLNAYNAYTVQSVLEHPRIKSIREIAGVWDKATHKVGGFDLTLDEIEHGILRPYFKDPRLHFALNCAARSCPPLPPWAFDGERIDEQLEERAGTFLGDPANVRVERGGLLVPKLLDWYGSDFIASGWRGAAPTVAAYVARYSPREIAAFITARGGRPALGYHGYDWSLNAAPAPALTAPANLGRAAAAPGDVAKAPAATASSPP